MAPNHKADRGTFALDLSISALDAASLPANPNGELAPSKAPRVADWQFDYNATLTVRAEELGFDLIFGLAQSPGSEGHGGETAYRKNSLDSMLVAAGKAALTR